MTESPMLYVLVHLVRYPLVPLPPIEAEVPAQFPVARQTTPLSFGKVHVLSAVRSSEVIVPVNWPAP